MKALARSLRVLGQLLLYQHINTLLFRIKTDPLRLNNTTVERIIGLGGMRPRPITVKLLDVDSLNRVQLRLICMRSDGISLNAEP